MGEQHDSRPRSREVTEGVARAPARAMLRAVGFEDDDFRKPQVGVASSWNEVTPCNYHLDLLADEAKSASARPARSPSSSRRSRSPTASLWATRGCARRSSAARSSPTRSSW